MSKVGIFGAGWVGLVTGACFAELGHEIVIRDVVASKIDALQRGEVPVPRGQASGAARVERRPHHVHARRRRRGRLRVPVRLRRHAADVLGRRGPLAGLDGRRRAARARGPSDPRHEVDRPGRHGREGAGRARPARARARRLRLEPRVPRRGPRDRRLHGPGPRSWSARSQPTTPRRSRGSTTRSTRRSCAPTSTRPR